MLKLTLCLLSISCTSNAFQVGCWHWGRCPNLNVQQSFSIVAYQGEWFQQAGYNTWPLEGNSRCVSTKYTLNQTVNLLRIENRGLSNFTNKWVGVNGTAFQNNPSKHEGKLTAVFHLGWFTVSGDYWVLGTDYGNYTVVYSCTNHLYFFHEYNVWFLSRVQKFSSSEHEQSYFDATNNVLIDHNLDPSIMERACQSNCDIAMD